MMVVVWELVINMVIVFSVALSAFDWKTIMG